MNLHWAQSNKYLLVIVASAVAIDGVLTTLVIDQRHDHSAANGQVSLPAAPPIPVPSIPALAPAAPQLAIPLIPPSVASTPQIIAPPQQALAPHKPKTPFHRRINPTPAPAPAPAPPPTLPRPDTPVKPGTPPELS